MDPEGDWCFTAVATDGIFGTRWEFMQGRQGFVLFRSVKRVAVHKEVCEGFVVALFLIRIRISKYNIEL